MGKGHHTPHAHHNACPCAGSSMILGVLFYLRQAHEYLQEGMTYRLGCSFYLAWTGVFLFLMTGLGLAGAGFGHGFRDADGDCVLEFGMGTGLWQG